MRREVEQFITEINNLDNYRRSVLCSPYDAKGWNCCTPGNLGAAFACGVGCFLGQLCLPSMPFVSGPIGGCAGYVGHAGIATQQVNIYIQRQLSDPTTILSQLANGGTEGPNNDFFSEDEARYIAEQCLARRCVDVTGTVKQTNDVLPQNVQDAIRSHLASNMLRRATMQR